MVDGQDMKKRHSPVAAASSDGVRIKSKLIIIFQNKINVHVFTV